MTLPDSPSEETTAVCPFVGLADDRDSHANYSTAAHRCYRLPEPTRIAAHYQESYCLTVQHPSCAVFQGEGVEATAPKDEPTGESEEPEAETIEEEVVIQANLESSYTEESPPTKEETYEVPEPTGSRTFGGGGDLFRNLRFPKGQRNTTPTAAVALGALAVVIILLAILITRLITDNDNENEIIPAEIVATQAATTPEPTPEPTQAATTPEPTPEPTSEPTPEPTPEPTVAPAMNEYEVKAGDTCLQIAIDNNVNLTPLLDANNLTEEDCTTIQIGQILIIPDPEPETAETE